MFKAYDQAHLRIAIRHIILFKTSPSWHFFLIIISHYKQLYTLSFTDLKVGNIKICYLNMCVFLMYYYYYLGYISSSSLVQHTCLLF